MILVRLVLVSLIIYLIVRSFIRMGEEGKSEKPVQEADKRNKADAKKVSKEIGEYIDYEEVKK
jgi:hypothetical protein